MVSYLQPSRVDVARRVSARFFFNELGRLV